MYYALAAIAQEIEGLIFCREMRTRSKGSGVQFHVGQDISKIRNIFLIKMINIGKICVKKEYISLS